MRINKSTLKMIAIAAVAVIIVSFIGHITGGFQSSLKDASLRDRNPDNLLTGKYTAAGWKDDAYNVGDGYKLTASNDGTVTVNGKYTGSESCAAIELESLTLAAGTYTLSGATNGGNQTYLIRATYDGNTAIGDFSASKTFTLTSSTEVTVELVLYGDYDFNYVKVRPVLVEGSDVGDFYK